MIYYTELKGRKKPVDPQSSVLIVTSDACSATGTH